MLHAQASERALIDQFLAALRSLPEVQAELERVGSPELDVQLALDVAGKPIHGLVELRKAIYPRDVRQLVWRIRDQATHERLQRAVSCHSVVGVESASIGCADTNPISGGSHGNESG